MSTKSAKKSKKSEKRTSTPLDDTKTKTTGLKITREPQAFTVDEWDWDRLIFSDPVKEEFGGGAGSGYRTKIYYKYDDETMGPAIVSLDKHYCFGVQQDNLDKDGNIRIDKETGQPAKLKGYRMPLVMTSQSKNSPNEITEEEQKELDFFDNWKEEMLRYCVENKAKIGKKNKTDAIIGEFIKKLLFRKGENSGEPEEGVSPKLYTNLIYYRNKKEIGTTFYGPGEKEVDPLSKQMQGHSHIYANIVFESLYVGAKSISLQHKVYDCTVIPVKKTPRKRLARPNLAVEEDDDGDDNDDDDGGSVGHDEDDDNLLQSEDE